MSLRFAFTDCRCGIWKNGQRELGYHICVLSCPCPPIFCRSKKGTYTTCLSEYLSKWENNWFVELIDSIEVVENQSLGLVARWENRRVGGIILVLGLHFFDFCFCHGQIPVNKISNHMPKHRLLCKCFRNDFCNH